MLETADPLCAVVDPVSTSEQELATTTLLQPRPACLWAPQALSEISAQKPPRFPAPGLTDPILLETPLSPRDSAGVRLLGV